MQYRNGCGGDRISILGFGCMRLSKKGGSVDLPKAEKELMAALDGGVNYLDTAYFYRGNEAALGKILAKNKCRDKVFIADKLPQFFVLGSKDLDRFFEASLKRLGTDCIDYYMIHAMTDMAGWKRLVDFGIIPWIKQKKEEGKIRHIGFSFHGNGSAFREMVHAYPWDFCQIQYNYMDEHTQAGREGLMEAASLGMPVIVMEPLRGGRLAWALPKAAVLQMEAHPRHWSPVEWAFHWLWDQPQVTCVLSGMNSMDMITQNLEAARAAMEGCMTPEDGEFIEGIREEIKKATRVGCTGCGYCMPCPYGVDIPGAFRCDNLRFTEGKRTARLEYIKTTALKVHPGKASGCRRCGACLSHCPQKIAIPDELEISAKALETPVYKLAALGYGFLNRGQKGSKQGKNQR